MAQASLRALEDCGLTLADVDGLFAATTQLPMAPLNLAQELGIAARYTDAHERRRLVVLCPRRATRARRSPRGCARSR